MAAQAVDFTVSGHVNRALFLTDYNNSTKATIKDGGSSGTRIRVTGSSEMEAGGSIGVNLEYAAGGTMTLRHAAINMKGDFGNVSLGQSDQAGNWKANPSVYDIWGIGIGQDMVSFGTKAVAAESGADGHPHVAVAGHPFQPYFSSLSNGRNERVRYDSPAIGPVNGSVSVGNGDVIGVEANLSQAMGVASFSGGVGAQTIGGTDSDFFGARAVIKLANGLGWSVGFGQRQNHDGGTTNPSFIENTVAYSMDGTGNTAVGLSWYAGTDFVNEDSDSTAIGIGAHHTLSKLGVRLYVAAQNYSVDDPAANGGAGLDNDGNVFVAGARVTF